MIIKTSPNHGPRRGDVTPDMVVLHYTGMTDAAAALDRLCDRAAEVSAHYLVDLDGTVFALVPEDRRAWHAGQGAWGAVTDVNSHSIGIEIVNPGHHLGYPPFSEPQMAAVEALLASILGRWSIPPERVIGHACMAPGRKIDPGEKFDWRRLASKGLSVWLEQDHQEAGDPDAAAFQQAARTFGYPVPNSAEWCDPTLAVWRAYAMRFLPQRAESPPDSNGIAHLEKLAAHWPINAGIG